MVPVILALGLVHGVHAQEPAAGFLDVPGATIHYLDFGGDGPPVVFIHAADRGAETWVDFAPFFSSGYRVLAPTARGVDPSTGEPAAVDIRAADLLAVMDALSIERAVFVGNSSPAQDMTYLAEHFPHRVAGLVYLANAPPVAGVEDSDPTGAFALALAATQPPDPFPYRPLYLDAGGPESIRIPALTFVGNSGTRGMESQVYPLLAARMIAAESSDLPAASEPARFLRRLAEDEALQATVREAWEQHVVPAIMENENAFRDAFGGHLQIAELPIPVVTGYEYMRQPALVTPPIKDFLDSLDW